MAKLAAFPKCYLEDIVTGKMALFAWIEMASKLPVDGLEMYYGFLRRHDANYLKQVRAAIADRNFEMPMMCYSPDFTHPDPSERQRQVNQQKEVIMVSAEMGATFCRILSGQKRPNLAIDEGIEWVVESIEACLQTAEACGVVLVMENHYKDGFWAYPEFAQKMDVFLAIVNQIKSPWFGVQFDPSNSLVAGEDPLVLLEQVKLRVRTMHASDRHLPPGVSVAELSKSDGTEGYSTLLQHGVIGRGLNDYDAIFRTLKAVGFTGWISIEDGMNGMDELRESADFLRQKIQEHRLAET